MVKDVKWFLENKVIYISIYNINVFSEKHLELSIHAITESFTS